MRRNIHRIQLFRERLSEKVLATILKGIVGGFDFTVLQRNLKEWARGHGRMFATAKRTQQNTATVSGTVY